jgi:hypothetical protein
MTTIRNALRAQQGEPPRDRFELFEQFCAAAGVTPGVARLGVLLALPEQTQHHLWIDLARRLERECE